MKILINETERGFLIKEGVFQYIVQPGVIKINSKRGETIVITTCRGQVSVPQMELQVLLRDATFAASVTKIEVPESSLAIHFIDGKFCQTLASGTYYYWNIFEQHTVHHVDMNMSEVQVPVSHIRYLPKQSYQEIIVSTGEVGLLFFDEVFQRELQPGTYRYWPLVHRITCPLVDVRMQQLDILGQEILTADKVMLRLNFVCMYRVTDAVQVYGQMRDYKSQIYVIAQLALREYVGQLKFDELLERKNEVAQAVLAVLQQKQGELFVNFTDAGLKDIILPGEVKEIMNMVLIAEKKAQANVVARREEVASTRSLLNTAKLMEENQTLYKLKELEYLEKICDKVGNISLGNGSILTQLGEIVRSNK